VKRTLRTLVVLALVMGLALGIASVAEAKNATRITMNRRALTMDWNTMFTLGVSLTPTKASDRGRIVWDKVNDVNDVILSITPDASSRRAVVRVRARAGEEPYPTAPILVTATSSVTGRKATCAITLKPVNVRYISVSPAARTVYLTESEPNFQMPKPYFAFTGSPVTSDQLSYTWSSDNLNVATVSADGLVTFVGEGTARIRATYTSGTTTLWDDCRFVVRPIRVRSIALSESTHYMDQGESFPLLTTVTSTSSRLASYYREITWKSEDTTIATVENGVVEAGSKSGIVKITAFVDRAPYVKSASCMVYVRETNPTHVTITAGGDCVLGGDPRTSGITARSTQRNYEKLIATNGVLHAYPFAKIAKLFDERGATNYTNLSIVNLEVCLTTKGGSNPKTTRKFLFRGNPGNAQALAAAGIDVANIANNHTADMGLSSFANTASSVKNAGGGAEPSGYNRYNGANYVPVMEVGEAGATKRVGFYGFQANQLPLSQVASRVSKVKKDYDLDMLVVSIHWTGQREHVQPVNSTMRAYSRKAIDYGADVVLGHHRHIISGIERYKGKYIIYDLGNLVTGGGDLRYTYVAQLDFDISGSFTESPQDAIRIYPLCTMSSPQRAWNSRSRKYLSQSNNWQPVPGEEAIDYIDKDTLQPVRIPDAAKAKVIEVLTRYSPVGADGKKFDPTSYIKSCPPS